jgi:histidinol-phosphate aminotransferase
MNILSLIRENIKNITPYSSARDEFTDFNTEIVFLDANENPFETDVNRYPDPQQKSVKEILAKQKNTASVNILLGNGSDEVLDLLFRAFCEPNVDNIITLPPTYGMYKVLANINAIATREVQLTSDFQPAVTQILSAADVNSKLLFLCSPNNPTGNSFKTAEVEDLLNNFEGVVVIDEAYIDFSETKSWLDRLNEFPNLVITQTLSKAYGMAGIRLGVCYASAEIISILNHIKPPYNVNQLTQSSAFSRLKNKDEIVLEIGLIKTERKKLIVQFQQIKFVKTVYPTDANFFLIKVDDATKRYQQLIAKGIVIRNRTKQVLCNNCLRITIGTPEENKKLIDTLKILK